MSVTKRAQRLSSFHRGALCQVAWLIFLFGYLTFFIVAFWVHDLPTIREKVATIAAIYMFDAGCLVVFIGVLGWI